MDSTNNIQESGAHTQNGNFVVYTRRWYIIIIYSMYSCTQSVVWNTWGPISTTSMDAFGWQTSTIAWLNNWGSIPYVLTGLFFMWLLQIKGLRWATVSSMFCVAVGTSFRVISSEPRTATILIHIGQFINGLGGPISSGAIPVVSATWFRPEERVTATALSNSLNVFGTAIAYVLGPALVTDVPSNKSLSLRTFSLFQNFDTSSIVMNESNASISRKQNEREEIMKYMYYECGWAVFLFIVIVCYFPSKPPLPPCVSASMERQPYWSGLLSLRKKGYFLLVALLFGVSTGVFGGWTSLLNINLSTVPVSEETAGWMGFYSTLAGCVGSLLVGRFAHLFMHYMKAVILMLYIVTTAALVVFCLMLIHIVPSSVAGFYITIITANTAINIAVPLLYELSCELAYPTGEGSANGVLLFSSNICGLVFLAVCSIQSIGTMWMNWAVIGSTGICIFMLAVLKGRLNRLEVDESIHPENFIHNEIRVPEQFGDEDLLLPYEVAPPSNVGSRVDVIPKYCGVQNPALTDAAMSC